MKSPSKILLALTLLSGVGTATAADSELFKGRELALSLFGSYVDKDDSDVAPGGGVSYFFTQHLGIGAFTHWENFEGTFIDNLSAEGYFRFPLDRLKLAPYAVVAWGYSFETEESFWAPGAGVEWRLNEKWGFFGDLRWQINDDTDDGVAVRFGARLVF